MTISLLAALKVPLRQTERKWKGPSKAFGNGHDQPGTPLKSSTPRHDRGFVIPSYKLLCLSFGKTGTVSDLNSRYLNPVLPLITSTVYRLWLLHCSTVFPSLNVVYFKRYPALKKSYWKHTNKMFNIFSKYVTSSPLHCMWNSPSPRWVFYWHWASAAGAWLLWRLSWSNRSPWMWIERERTVTTLCYWLSEIMLYLKAWEILYLNTAMTLKYITYCEQQIDVGSRSFNMMYIHRNTHNTECTFSKKGWLTKLFKRSEGGKFMVRIIYVLKGSEFKGTKEDISG